MHPPITKGTVLGVGVDLVDIARIRELGARHGAAFLDKVFTAEEQKSLAGRIDPWPGYAARFAAKEAVSKAFGTGIGAQIGFLDIRVIADEAGAPRVELTGNGAVLLRARGGSGVLVSLTHTSSLAQAFAVLAG